MVILRRMPAGSLNRLPYCNRNLSKWTCALLKNSFITSLQPRMNKKYCSRAKLAKGEVFYGGNSDRKHTRVKLRCKRNFSSENEVLRKKNPRFSRCSCEVEHCG